MEYTDKEYCLEVWGDWACFTRPELKVERVSYDVITPSAARAIFESIFWKPAIHWRITRIDVLNPIKMVNIKRNEVKGVVTEKAPCITIDDGKSRVQRNSLILKDVRYRIYAKQEFIPTWRRKDTKNPIIDIEESDMIHKNENPGKYNAMFERRAKKGQCFVQPYLGCREFSCSFRFVDFDKEVLKPPLPLNKDLGLMFHDYIYNIDERKRPRASYFPAQIVNGVILIDENSIIR